MRICLHVFPELTAEVKYLRMIDFIHMLGYWGKKIKSMVENPLNQSVVSSSKSMSFES